MEWTWCSHGSASVHTQPLAVLMSRDQDPAHPHKASLVLQTHPHAIAADVSRGKEGTASPLGSSALTALVGVALQKKVMHPAGGCGAGGCCTTR